jgi:hypothetical protein
VDARVSEDDGGARAKWEEIPARLVGLGGAFALIEEPVLGERMMVCGNRPPHCGSMSSSHSHSGRGDLDPGIPHGERLTLDVFESKRFTEP